MTAAQGEDYILPFIEKIRELIDENEKLFSEAEEIKQLLLKYLSALTNRISNKQQEENYE